MKIRIHTEYLSVLGACKLLGVSRTTVERVVTKVDGVLNINAGGKTRC